MEDPARGHELSETLAASSSGDATPSRTSHVFDGEDLQAGTRVDRYEVIELLGEGSMGRVYRARDTDLSREVALKRIYPGRWTITTAQLRLRREAQAMARVEHPAVIRVYDVPVADGELFVAMELARGGTVASWMKARPRRWRDVMRIFIEAGRGLAAAHQVGLVHRDFKPSNILLDGHGRAKVSDFGLARMFGAIDCEPEEAELAGTPELHASLTRTGAIAGTLAYMAPEQLGGEPIDARADQFSFCVALWEALCGKRPFRIGEPGPGAPQVILQAISSGSLDGPGVVRRAGVRVPRRVLGIVRRGLAADRAQRWASMDELLDALERATRPPRIWWLAAAVVLAVAIATVVQIARSPAHAPPPVCGKRDQIAVVWSSRVRAAYRSAAPSPATDEDAGWFDWYARALDAEYAASCGHADPPRIACLDEAVEDLRTAIARPERNYWPRLRAIDRCGTTLRETVVGDVSNGEVPLLSTDGRQLSLAKAGARKSTLHEIGGSGSRPLDLAFPLRWLPDGSIVGFDDQQKLEVVDPATNRVLRSLDPGGSVVDVSPDLKDAAVFGDGRLSIVPIAGGKSLIEPIAVGGEWPRARFSPDGRRFAVVTALEMAPGSLYIDDLVTHHRETVVFRVHEHGTGYTEVRWLDPTSLVVSGSAIAEVQGDLWRLRVDPSGRLVAPPQILVRSDRDMVLLVHDVQPGKLLVDRVRLAVQNLAIDGETTSQLPGSPSRLSPVATDRAHRRALAATDASGTRWAWMSLDGSRVEPIATLDGLRAAVAGPTGIAALDLRSEPPVYVAFDEAGAELARLPIDAARGTKPTLRCGASRCVVKWAIGEVPYTAAIEGHSVGPAIRRELPELVAPRIPWELSDDGTQIAFGTSPYSRALIIHDLERSVSRQVTSDALDHIQRGWFLHDGSLVLAGLGGRSDTEVGFALIKRDPKGHEHVLWRGDAWITGFVPLDDHRMIVSTLSYQFRLGLFEAP